MYSSASYNMHHWLEYVDLLLRRVPRHRSSLLVLASLGFIIYVFASLQTQPPTESTYKDKNKVAFKRDEEVFYRHPFTQRSSNFRIEINVPKKIEWNDLEEIEIVPSPKTTPIIFRTTRPPRELRRLYVWPIGGIGNQLFEAAACISIALETGREPVLSPAFEQLFRMFSISLKVRTPPYVLPQVKEVGFAIYSRIAYWSPSSDAILNGYFQSWRYFQAYGDIIHKQFTLKKSLLSLAEEARWKACERICGLKPGRTPELPSNNRTQVPNHVCKCENPVYIGVHIRRQDVGPNYRKIPASYFNTAMDFFRKRFKSTIFMVVSDDIQWGEKNIIGKDVFILPAMSSDRHFAVLTGCNHHVISVGSFGWWAAWLAGGITVHYDDPVPEDFSKRNEFNPGDYFPKQWISML